MPYVSGETLRTRLEREKQLSITDALRIAREVADALGAAHSLGIVHRDVKPENILLQGGHAIVADFGIALAVQQAGAGRMTQTGLSLGTPQYMSPEQAMGERTIDGRSDVYALGAVTYEMIAGEPPFSGPSVQAIVAKVMSERPTPLTMVRDTVPAGVENAVLTALAKLPADRFATAGEFAAALDDRSATSHVRSATIAGVSDRRRTRDPLVMGLVALVLLLAVAMVPLARRASSPSDAFPLRLVVPTTPSAFDHSPALSPDGHTLIYPASVMSGNGLMVRSLDGLTSHAVPGATGVSGAVFSPDGRSIAYFSDRRSIVRIPAEGGTPVPLGTVGDNGGLSWSPSGEIVAGGGVYQGLTGLLHVNAAGGTLAPLTHVDTSRHELSHQMPCALADGRTVLFTIWHGAIENAELAGTHLDDGRVVPLGVTGARALGVVDNMLVYVRADGMVMAVSFDARALRATGVAMPVGDSARIQGIGGGSANAEAQLNAQGGLAYVHGSARRRVLWVDRNGTATPALSETREFNFVRLSPDGRRAAVGLANGIRSDIWIADLTAKTFSPLTTTGSSRNPVWSRDGRSVFFASTHAGRAAFWWQDVAGGVPRKVAEPEHNPWNYDVSPDGHTVVFNAIYGNGTFNLEAMSLDSAHGSRDLAASPTAVESDGQFSPDGRFIAYMSNESGQYEIYVMHATGASGGVLISSGGGRKPRWSSSGRELFYWSGRKLMSTTLALEPEVHPLKSAPLFEGDYEQDFDVARDGSRFLMIERTSDGLDMVVIPAWRTELKRLVKAQKPR